MWNWELIKSICIVIANVAMLMGAGFLVGLRCGERRMAKEFEKRVSALEDQILNDVKEGED